MAFPCHNSFHNSTFYPYFFLFCAIKLLAYLTLILQALLVYPVDYDIMMIWSVDSYITKCIQQIWLRMKRSSSSIWSGWWHGHETTWSISWCVMWSNVCVGYLCLCEDILKYDTRYLSQGTICHVFITRSPSHACLYTFTLSKVCRQDG